MKKCNSLAFFVTEPKIEYLTSKRLREGSQPYRDFIEIEKTSRREVTDKMEVQINRIPEYEVDKSLEL
jgi:hypothetical protein